VQLSPWDYVRLPFSPHNFPDLFTPLWVVALALLIILVVLYNVRTRALHRHQPYVDLWEWLLWTGIAAFGLILVAAVFNFSFYLLLIVIAIGLGALIWVRFIRFPPVLRAYETRLAKQRYLTKTKLSRPESTIRPKGKRSRRRR
jgi:hypothetical protein